MNPFGAACLLVAALGGVAVVVAPSGGPARRAGRWMIAGGWWVGTLFLTQRFVALDLSLREVVGYSRAELSTGLRAAGMWAGPSGSLLLWITFLVSAVLLAGRGSPPSRWTGLASVAGAAVLVAGANPFRHDTTVPVNGRGLSPVLEHPAMLIHPPLLYLAHAAVVYAAVRSVRTDARRPAAVAAALLVVATLLGAWWAHDELGWGGWWAWDPVENTALAPLAALVAALHTSGVAARRWTVGAAAVALAGVAAARSGLAASVHAFAPSPWPSLALLVAAILTARAVMASHNEVLPCKPIGEPIGLQGKTGSRWAERATGGVAAWVVIVVVTAEVAAAWLGSRSRPGALDGSLVARLLIPVGVVVAVGIVVLGWNVVGRLGMGLAHAGVLVFAIGVVASLGDWSEGAVVDVGRTVVVHGEQVTVGTPAITDDRPDLRRVTLPVTIGGHEYHPSILRYPDLGRSRSRPDRRSDWRGETEVVTTYVDGDRARIEVRRHPGLGQVWTGGVLTALGLVVVGAGWGQSRRSRLRLAANSESIEEAGGVGGDAGGAVGADAGGDTGGDDGLLTV